MSRTSQFAKIQLVVPNPKYKVSSYEAQNNSVKLITVGLAQSIRVEDNFGTKAENVIGTPLPVFHPGFQQTTISIEKATIDGYSFRSFGAFNPLWASIGSTYIRKNLVSLKGIDTEIAPSDTEIFPFMFILAVKDIVSDSYSRSNFPEIGDPYKEITSPDQKAQRTNNLIGSYVCVLNSANTSMSSQNAVIMDNISAYARPLTGGWFTDALRDAFKEENKTNGMDHEINSALYGYFSEQPNNIMNSGAKA